MDTLALAMLPKPGGANHATLLAEADEGFLGKLARRIRARAGAAIRYRRALRELRRLDDRDLDDLGIGRADLPELARRHAGLVG
jgi:uncharacterized protein YjiS (DUF1127 family)